MTTLTDLKKAALGGSWKVKQTIQDLASALHIWYDGPLKFAEITVGGSALITGYADDTDGSTTKAGWGTAGVITHSAAATDTLGEIADEINTMTGAGWHCRITGGLRATTVNVDGDIVDQAAVSCLASVGGVHLYLTSSGTAIEEHFIEASGWSATTDNRGVIVELGRIACTMTASTATSTAPKIYLCKGIAHADKEELIWTGVDLSTTTLQALDFDIDGNNSGLRGEPGEHFVIKYGVEGTTVFTVAKADITYRAIDAPMQMKYRADRQ